MQKYCWRNWFVGTIWKITSITDTKRMATTRVFCGKRQTWLVTQLWLITLLLCSMLRWWVGPQNKWQLIPQSVSDCCDLNSNVCDQSNRDPVCDFLVCWLQIAISPVCFVSSQSFWLYVFRFQVSQMCRGPLCGLNMYSRLSLSRTRLSRITAYLEVKIWSLF